MTHADLAQKIVQALAEADSQWDFAVDEDYPDDMLRAERIVQAILDAEPPSVPVTALRELELTYRRMSTDTAGSDDRYDAWCDYDMEIRASQHVFQLCADQLAALIARAEGR